MAIGKPLRIDIERGVQEQVLSARTTPLSSDVAAQKLPFTDYGIVAANVDAAFAPTKELANMVGVLGKTAMYIAKTKEAHRKVQIGDQFRELQDSFRSDMAMTQDLIGRENLHADYKASIESLSNSASRSLYTTPESQEFISSARNQANNIAYTAFTTIESQRFKQINGSLDAGLKLLEDNVAQNPNVDIIKEISNANSIFKDKFNIGALSLEGLLAAKNANTQKFLSLHASALGTQMGRNYDGTDKHPWSSAKNALTQFTKKLADNQIPISRVTEEVFIDNYSKAAAAEMDRLNQDDRKREDRLIFIQRKKVNDTKTDIAVLVSEGRLNAEEAEKRAKKLEGGGHYTLAAEVRKAASGFRTSPAKANVVEEFTDTSSEKYAGLIKHAYDYEGNIDYEGAENYLVNIVRITHPSTIRAIIGTIHKIPIDEANQYINGAKRTDTMQNVLFSLINANRKRFMMDVGLSPDEFTRFQNFKAVNHLNADNLLSALGADFPKLTQIINRMESIVATDTTRYTKNTMFERTVVVDEGGVDTGKTKRWQDDAQSSEFQKDYYSYMETVFHKARKEYVDQNEVKEAWREYEANKAKRANKLTGG